jgi:Dyp-type peroxidase family
MNLAGICVDHIGGSAMTASSSYPGPQPEDNDLPLRSSTTIQGNILAGFNKDHQDFIFVNFVGDQAKARAWLNELADPVADRIATTQQVANFNKQFRAARQNRGGDDPENLKAVWVNVGLTSSGLLTFAPGLTSDLEPYEAFREGPRARAQRLGDQGLGDPANWVMGAEDQQPIDAVLTIAADESEDLRGEVEKQRTLLAKYGLMVVFEQPGETLPGPRRGHEHFGFKDGISQPGIRGFTPIRRNENRGRDEDADHPGSEIIAAGEFVLGLERDPEAAEQHPRPAPPDWMRDGSFQVFRRLAQDVPGWWAQVTRNSQSLPSDEPMAEDVLAAKLVGRWRSGTPLALAPDRDNRSARIRDRDNDFDFDNDFEGHATPRFAHIRKMYPRNDRFDDDVRRILRRGIPFGPAFDPAAGRGHGVDVQRGLLFNVFMASFEDQFEFLQAAWANFSNFPSVVDQHLPPTKDGPDPVIGESPDPILLRRPDLPERELDFRRFVHVTGAVYAFAPSIPTLRALASSELT